MARPVRRVHRLGGGPVLVRGDGPVSRLLEAHLGAAEDEEVSEEPWIIVDLARRVPRGDEGARRIRSRRGAADVTDGDPVHVRWDRRLRRIRPLLVAGHLAARRRRAVLLHGAALTWGAGAVVVTGPSGVGKTRILLAARAAGASVLAPDWSWLAVDDGTLHPLPQPVRLRPHHVDAAGDSITTARRWALATAGAIGGPVGSRAHVDVPLASIAATIDARPSRLVGVIVLGGRAEPSPMTAADLAPWTADPLAGTTSTDLLRALEARIVVRAGDPASPELVVALAREVAG